MSFSVEIFIAGSSKLSLRADCVQFSSLKLAIIGVFMPLELADLQMRVFAFFSEIG